MTFFEAIHTCLIRKYATFTGRASRSEYWWFQLFVFPAMFATVLALPEKYAQLGFLPWLMPMWSAAARRMQDVGRSGWLQLINLLPGGFLLLLYWTVIRGQPTANKWGPPTTPVDPDLPSGF